MRTFDKPINPESQGFAWKNLKAFDAALLEADSGVYMIVSALVEKLAAHLKERGNITSLETARNQAVQVVAQIVACGKYDRLFLDIANQ